MTPFTVHEGTVADLPLANVDTDQLLPARFLKKPRGPDYGGYLLRDLRFDAEGQPTGFVLNRVPDASVLLAGPAFGSGSSREGAVYALVDFGIRAILAQSFGDIFRTNAARNGLLCAELAAADHAALRAAHLAGATRARLDLEARTATIGPVTVPFAIDPGDRRRLLGGLDDVGMTLTHAAAIARHIEEVRRREPWRLLPAQGSLAGPT